MTNNTTAALTDEQIIDFFSAAGVELNATPNMLYTVRGQHAQLVNAARALLTSPRAGLPIVGYLIDSPDEPDIGHWFSEEPDTIHRCRALGIIDAAPAGPGAEPTFTDAGRAALAWVLWHHQGASSFVGQPIRYALGMGQHEELSDAQIEEAKSIARLCKFPGKQHSAAQAVAADGEPLVRNLSPLERVEEDIVVMTRMSNDTKRLPMEETESLARLLYYIDDLRRAAVSPATAEPESIEARIAALMQPNPADELGPTDEPESQYRFGYNTAIEDALIVLENGGETDAAEPCAHDYVRSDRVCTECGEKTATADEQADWSATRHSLAIAIAAFGTRPDGRRGTDAAAQMLESITEPGSPLSWLRASQAAAPAEAREPHSDDIAVDAFAAAMKAKMAASRAKGRGGWETCTPSDLSRMLREHVEKGDPRDVANFCMMLHHHGAPIGGAADAGEAVARAYPDALTEDLRHVLGFPNFRCGPYAHLMRAAGADIQRKAEDEQAHVLHWLVKLVIDHGERWADVAQEELDAMREKVAGHQGAQAGKGGEA